MGCIKDGPNDYEVGDGDEMYPICLNTINRYVYVDLEFTTLIGYVTSVNKEWIVT